MKTEETKAKRILQKKRIVQQLINSFSKKAISTPSGRLAKYVWLCRN